jgi:hypothetical protein
MEYLFILFYFIIFFLRYIITGKDVITSRICTVVDRTCNLFFYRGMSQPHSAANKNNANSYNNEKFDRSNVKCEFIGSRDAT